LDLEQEWDEKVTKTAIFNAQGRHSHHARNKNYAPSTELSRLEP